MAVEIGSVRTRRALLVGAAGGVAALVAQAFGRPEPALGADVVLGGTNTTDATTTIQNTSNLATVLNVKSSKTLAMSARGRRRRTVCWSRLTRRDRSSVERFWGSSVCRQSARESSVGARTLASGLSANKVGVLGFAGGDGPSNIPPNAGVYGWSTAEGIGVSMGVLGRSTAPAGYGVFGTSNSATGVQGFTKSGTALSATVGSGGSGRALVANGRVHLQLIWHRDSGIREQPEGGRPGNRADFPEQGARDGNGQPR